MLSWGVLDRGRASGGLMKVRFTGQQLVLIDKIVAEGAMGKTREEVIRAMFRQYVLQTLGGDQK